MLQKAQKPPLKGIIAVTRILDDFMKAEKCEKPLPSSESVMKILSDSVSLSSDASHEIDLRRRTLIKGDMKTEYGRLLCSDQNPVENGLLFETELGKSGEDLTEASKVTSKVTMKQKRPHTVLRVFREGQNLEDHSFFRPRQRLGWQVKGRIQKSTTQKPTTVSASTISRKPNEKPANSVQVRIMPNDLQQSVGQFGSQCGNTQVNKQFVQAGRLKFHLKEWEEITSNKFILDIVQGYLIEFISVPIQSSQPKQPKLDKHEEIALNVLLEELLQKRVIEKCAHEAGKFVSPVFLRPKKNGEYRMILNLKNLNKFISHIHFKMDTLQSCINLMKMNCFMASLDLTDAYYSVSISPDSQKYLKFQVGSQLYKFITLPNGLSSAPRIFTKLMKPVYSTLRTRGLVSSGYLDDSFLLGDSSVQCQTNANNTYTLFGDLGFNVSKEKSVTQPTQVLEHSGFVLNSINMTVSLTREKIDSITRLAQDILRRPTCSIREAEQLIGTLVSSSPGVEYGPLFYRQPEIEKIDALKKHKGSFKVQMQFSELARSDIDW